MGYIGREQWDPRGIRLDPLHIDLREWASRCTETKRRIVVGCYDREAKTGWTIPVLPSFSHERPETIVLARSGTCYCELYEAQPRPHLSFCSDRHRNGSCGLVIGGIIRSGCCRDA